MTCEPETLVLLSMKVPWSQGTTILPDVNCMAWHGPVAYHVHPPFFVDRVISLGFDHVSPSSSEYMQNTLLVSMLSLAWIFFSGSFPLFHVESRMILPETRSTTGDGFPQTFSASSHTVMIGPHVFPPSVERLSTRSMSPVSEPLLCLASAKASTVPALVCTMAGIL